MREHGSFLSLLVFSSTDLFHMLPTNLNDEKSDSQPL